MTWDGRDQHAPFGEAARLRPGGSTYHRESGQPSCGCEYPPTRYPPAAPAGMAATVFPRYQSATLTLAPTTAFQEVIRFAGRPANITLAASAAGLNFRLSNRGEEGLDGIRVLGTAPLVLYVSKEIVEVQDPTGAGGQIVSAQGGYQDVDI